MRRSSTKALDVQPVHPEKTRNENHHDHYADDIKDVHWFTPIVFAEAERGRGLQSGCCARVKGRKSETLASLTENDASFCFWHRPLLAPPAVTVIATTTE
jgi:hypothetical protein